MIQPKSFYKERNSNMKRNQVTKKSSVDAPKLTAKPAAKPRGRPKGKGKGEGQKTAKQSEQSRSRSSPEREIILDTLEEDLIDAQSLSGEENEANEESGNQQERDLEDQPNRHNPDDDDEEDFTWKCELLHYVEEYPLLYDKANPDFKNKYARLAAWEEIATSMDSDGMFPLCISLVKHSPICIDTKCNNLSIETSTKKTYVYFVLKGIFVSIQSEPICR